MKRRGGAFALALALSALAGACKQTIGTPIPPHTQDLDAAVYQECNTICVRPGDCARAYNDDGICPPGFLCAFRYTACSTD